MSAALHPARRLWRVCEVVHAVTYFAEQSRAAAKEAGLRGFWMGYFGFRGAPLGPVGPAAITSAFYNFEPEMVAKAIPDAWTFASPDELVVVRRTSAVAALTGATAIDADTIASAVDELWRFAAGADHGGRPLAAANAALERPDDLADAMWQGCTTFREHRGDGHVAVLVAEGLSGLEAHVLLSATEAIPPELLTDSRGWTSDDWVVARSGLAARGLMSPGGEITDAGRALRHHVEQRTDELSWRSIERAMGDPDEVVRRLAPVADAVIDAAIISFPNPMGLPAGHPSALTTE